ncbi:MAG: thermonuclease family protein [Halobacteriota archaeon]
MLKSLLVLILISLALLVAGCLEEDELTTTPLESPMNEQTPTASPTATPTATSTPAVATPTPTAVTTTTEPAGTPLPRYEYGVEYKAQIIGVIDGDTVDVIVYPDKTEERVRLLGIDAPEPVAVRNTPGEYDNITDVYCLETWGKSAKEYLTSAVAGRICDIEFDRNAGFRDDYGRLLAYVDYNRDVNAELVKLGLSRVYTEENFTRESEYLSYQVEAKEEGMGLWNCK